MRGNLSKPIKMSLEAGSNSHQTNNPTRKNMTKTLLTSQYVIQVPNNQITPSIFSLGQKVVECIIGSPSWRARLVL